MHATVFNQWTKQTVKIIYTITMQIKEWKIFKIGSNRKVFILDFINRMAALNHEIHKKYKKTEKASCRIY